MSLFTLGSAKAVLVVALVYSFLQFWMSLMWSWHWSPLTHTSLSLSPSDGLASFLKTTLANGVKVVKKVTCITSKFRFHLIAIYALGCFRNFSCTSVPTKITLKSVCATIMPFGPVTIIFTDETKKTLKDWSQFLFGSWRNNLNQVVHTMKPV
jgi:hypothetical protein